MKPDNNKSRNVEVSTIREFCSGRAGGRISENTVRIEQIPVLWYKNKERTQKRGRAVERNEISDDSA